MRPPLRLLLCSAPEDDALALALERHLRLLERAGFATLWSARAVLAGDDRASLLAAEIARAEVFVLLLSASFFTTTECTDAVMAEALRRHRAHQALVIPVLLRPVDWEVTDLRDLSCLPPNLLAVTSFHDVDEAFSRIEREVRRRIEARVTGLDRDPPPPTPDVADAEVGERSLDAAIPARVVKGERTEVLAMVAVARSGGLRALIAARPTAFPVKADDVRSTEFPLKFPQDHAGKPTPTAVTVMIESADFDPPKLTKTILVPPHADSTVCTMLVTPRKVGVLSLQIEVEHDKATIWSQRLATTGAESAEGPAPGYVIASAPLYTVSAASGQPAQIPLDPAPIRPPTWTATTPKPATFSIADIRGWGRPPPPPSPPAEAGDSPDEDAPVRPLPPAPSGPSPGANSPIQQPNPENIRFDPADKVIDDAPNTNTNIRIEPSNTNVNIHFEPAPRPARPFPWLLTIVIVVVIGLALSRVAGLWP